jgi:hypothetical protein
VLNSTNELPSKKAPRGATLLRHYRSGQLELPMTRPSPVSRQRLDCWRRIPICTLMGSRKSSASRATIPDWRSRLTLRRSVAERTSETRKIAPYLRGPARQAKARELAQRIVVGGPTPLEAAAEMSLTRDQVYKILRGAAYKQESADPFAVIGPERKAAAVKAERRMWELVP